MSEPVDRREVDRADDVTSTTFGVPFARRRLLSRFAWLPVLVLGVLAYEAVLQVMVHTDEANFFPSLLLIGAITVPASVLVYADGGGYRLALSPWLLAATAVFSGLLGTIAAGLLEYETLRDLGTLPMAMVGVIEEAAKLIVPVILYLVLRPQDPRGGVVVGIASGMGFATLETMGYGFQALLSSGTIAAVDDTLLLRALLSPACHIAWTGMTTAMLWHMHGSRRPVRARVAFATTFAVAAALHATWDGSTSVVVHVVVAFVGVLTLLVFLRRAHRGSALAPPTSTA